MLVRFESFPLAPAGETAAASAGGEEVIQDLNGSSGRGCMYICCLGGSEGGGGRLCSSCGRSLCIAGLCRVGEVRSRTRGVTFGRWSWKRPGESTIEGFCLVDQS